MLAHVDSIQLYGSSHTMIDGNFFHDIDTALMAPDGGENETFVEQRVLGW